MDLHKFLQKYINCYQTYQILKALARQSDFNRKDCI